MGPCPICKGVLLSTNEVAARLGVSPSRIRRILDSRPGRLQGGRVGWCWVIAERGVEDYQPQPTGVHLPGDGKALLSAGKCPMCGELLFSPKETAATIGVCESRVHAILSSRPERLMGFKVGSRWAIPQRGIEVYLQIRDGWQRVLDALTGEGTERVLVISPAGEDSGGSRAVEVAEPGTNIKVTFGPEICYCDAVHPKDKPEKRFPHRPGGGKCPHKPRVLRGTVVAELVSEKGEVPI